MLCLLFSFFLHPYSCAVRNIMKPQHPSMRFAVVFNTEIHEYATAKDYEAGYQP
jgi:hypothetical protein